MTFEIIPTRRQVYENKLKTTFNKVYGPYKIRTNAVDVGNSLNILNKGILHEIFHNSYGENK